MAIANVPSRPQASVFKLAAGTLSHQSILTRFRDHVQMVKTEIDKKLNGTASSTNHSPKTVAVFESITASPGLLLPWKDMVRICREENVLSVVDAAHSLGQEIDINLKEGDPDF